mmetsp:Transcript_24197/g.57802  ORF Transcript_24197/g.57802 Transcript_24197/m.57802 type:complete len:260 (-) Transcript_24197:107-886(-)
MLPWIAASPVRQHGDGPVHHLDVRVRAGRGAPRRRGQRPGRVLPRVRALGPRPGPRLEVEGVVVHEVAREVVDALIGRLRLQLLHHEVADAQPRRCERPRPHLEHPAEGLVGLLIALEGEAQLPVRLDHRPQLLLVDDHRRRADRVDGVRVVVLGHHRPQLGRVVLVRHVVEAEADRRALRSAVGRRPHQQVVRLHDEEVRLGDPGIGRVLEELPQPPWPVHHHKVVVALVAHAALELLHQHRGDLVHQPVGLRVRRVK